MKIFAGHDGGSGCCYYRIDLPLRQLAKHGHEVEFRSAADERGNKPVTVKDMAGYDVIIGQRYNTIRGLSTWRLSRTPSSRLVYETDDDVFSITPDNWQAYHVYSDPEVREAVTHMAEVSDLVTCTTDHLAATLRENIGDHLNITVLPNYIPSWVLQTARDDKSRPSVGWQGGASHGMDVGIIVASVKRFLKRFPGWDMRLGGTDYRPTFKGGDRVIFSNWVPVYENAPAYYDTIDWDIGLAPLAMKEFDKSKSNIKVLEYAARGIPSIATDCDVYRSFIKHGENGFLVKHEHEWLKYMSILAGDSDFRRAMGEQARADAAAWTIEGNWRKWESAYATLFQSLRVG